MQILQKGMQILHQVDIDNKIFNLHEIIGKIYSIETIAVDASIRDINRLRKHYGSGTLA